jgi:hypothetical protein
MDVFKAVSENGMTKPERGYEVSSRFPCPKELKENCFEKLTKLLRWAEILNS